MYMDVCEVNVLTICINEQICDSVTPAIQHPQNITFLATSVDTAPLLAAAGHRDRRNQKYKALSLLTFVMPKKEMAQKRK